MVTTENDRWVVENNEMPKHFGFVNGMTKFDAQFFKVHYKQAYSYESMGRKLLESTYGAIFDSGTNPMNLRGKNIGVFIGTSSSELEKTTVYENFHKTHGFGITGMCRTMYANRISYWLDTKGPSYSLDSSCASALMCIEHAYKSIKDGCCEAAIVGCSNYCMHPNVTLNFKRAGFLCMDGKTKSFDKNGDGYVRSDSINVLFLQKAKDAKRIYTEIFHIEDNYSLTLGDEFMPNRDVKFITNFFNEIYSKTNITPDEIEYVEGYAAGMGEADFNELEAIGKVFGQNKCIKVGSVKSNMGNSEAASGANAIIKLCLAYHKGQIPANLHYHSPPNHIPEVREGKVKVLQEHSTFNRGYTAVNTFSINGHNMHVVLKGHFKTKDINRYETSIPHIIIVSGRQEMCLSKIIDNLKKQPIDAEQIALLHNIHSTNISGHMCRGYAILEKSDKSIPTCLAEKVIYYPAVTRPIWFLYSGMGSQWAGMGAELMRIPIFSAAIEKCHKVLNPKGIDIFKILTDTNKTIYDNILNSFVGIAAVQIGLTDILKEIGIIPDNIIGHSVGELGCAYADGCLTAEEMILSAYSRGLVSIQTPFIKGSMAAVGLGYSSVNSICPPEITVACHNSSESSTISGPADVMKTFVSELKSRGVFAREVPCSNIAYHSRYIADAGPGLLKYLKEVITDPKPRSKKWLSTSVPKNEWYKSAAQYSSAEYHTHNLLNPVLFEETSKLIPTNAIVIEIAPHGLLQAIVKRSLSECAHIPLTRRGHPDPVKHLLEAFGEMYTIGVNPKLEALYPKVEFPVSTETPMLSHLVEWEHSEEWPFHKCNTADKTRVTERKFIMSIYEDDYKYLAGHVRNGQCVFPEAGLLVLVWETLAMSKGEDFRNMSVEFSDVKFSGEAIIQMEIPLELVIMINKGNMFEISFEQTAIVSGYIREIKYSHPLYKVERNIESNEIILSAKDIYKMFYLRGHSYCDEFQSLQSIEVNFDKGTIKWNNDWTTFLDGLIQMNALTTNYNGVVVPKLIKNLLVSVTEHRFNNNEISTGCFDINLNTVCKITRCGGVTISDIVFIYHPNIEQDYCLHTKVFIPHKCQLNTSMDGAIQIILQVVNENLQNDVIKVLEIKSEMHSEDISSTIKRIVQNIPNIEVILTKINKENAIDNKAVPYTNLIIINDDLDYVTDINNLYDTMTKDTFIMVLVHDKLKIQQIKKLFTIILDLSVGKKNICVLKKTYVLDDNALYIPIVHDIAFSWMSRVENELKKSKRVVLVSENHPFNGVLGFVKKSLKMYPTNLSVIIVDDKNAPTFNSYVKFFKDQLVKNLRVNILRKGQWGGEYCIPSNTISSELNPNFSLVCVAPGDIDSLTWVEKQAQEPKRHLVQVYYAAISQIDVRKAVNDDIVDKYFGMDFSGIDNNGLKVMGIIPNGAIATQVEADPNFVWPIPEHWSLEDAATVPLPYLLAYYNLSIKSKLLSEHTVLVTGGAGALGQAVISICLDIGCEVYTTVSDIHKKKFLLTLFPQLNERNIVCSNDSSFYDSVITYSNKNYCDIVINCKSGTLRESAMKCSGNYGCFIDLSSFDMRQNKSFGMSYVRNAKNYYKTELSNLFKSENQHEKKILHGLIAEGIAKGLVKPVIRVTYSPVEVSIAFRLLSTSRNRGRVLINMKDLKNLNQNLKIIPNTTCSVKGSYVVVCDENEKAVELVDELIRIGAKNVIFHVKSGKFSGYMAVKLNAWKKLKVTVETTSDPLQVEKNCSSLLTKTSTLRPVHGIFVVLDSDYNNFKEMDRNKFVQKFSNTAAIVMNLDSASRKHCPDLRYFAVFITPSRNSADSYNSAYIERICQSRHEMGLPALAYYIAINNQFKVDANDFQSILPHSMSGILNGLQRSFKLKKSYIQVLTTLKKETDTDFLDKISRILGIKNIDDIDENLTVSDFIVIDTNVMEIKSIMRSFYGIAYNYEKILSLSIAKIKQLHQTCIKRNTNFDGGLSAFYTHIDEDECLASEPMVALETKADNSVKINDLDVPLNETYLIMIPGFNGHYQIFESISQTLKVQARVLQLGPDLKVNNISHLASELLKFLKSRYNLQSKFYLMGYSFGVNVALELAALIETEGFTGVVYCLDSSPDALRAQLDAYLGNLTEAQLQNAIVEHQYRLMSGLSSDELSNDLRHAKTWPDKIQACINKLRGIVKYSNEYKRSIIISTYQRILLARDYVPNFKLQSQIVLIKGIPHPNQAHLPIDYNLSQYSSQPVQIFNIESDHALAPQDCRVTNILNKFFDSQVLQEFKKKNLCESYITSQHKSSTNC